MPECFGYLGNYIFRHAPLLLFKLSDSHQPVELIWVAGFQHIENNEKYDEFVINGSNLVEIIILA